MSFPASVQGRWGFEKDVTTSKKHKLGTIMQIEDTYYRYVKAGEDLIAGQLLEAPALIANHNDDLVVAANGTAGDSSVSVTVGGTAVTKNQYQDGYLYFNLPTATSGQTSSGFKYRIREHAAIDSSGTGSFTIDDAGGLAVGIVAGTDKAGLIPNLGSDVLIANTTELGPLVGVTQNDIADNSYGWAQFYGHSICEIQGTPGITLSLMRSNGTQGALEVSDGTQGLVGHMGRTAGVDTEFHEVFLNIG